MRCKLVLSRALSGCWVVWHFWLLFFGCDVSGCHYGFTHTLDVGVACVGDGVPDFYPGGGVDSELGGARAVVACRDWRSVTGFGSLDDR